MSQFSKKIALAMGASVVIALAFTANAKTAQADPMTSGAVATGQSASNSFRLLGTASGDVEVNQIAQRDWRYRRHNGRWWYWTPGNYWMVYGTNGWYRHGASRSYGYSNNYGNNYYGDGRRYSSGYRGRYDRGYDDRGYNDRGYNDRRYNNRDYYDRGYDRGRNNYQGGRYYDRGARQGARVGAGIGGAVGGRQGAALGAGIGAAIGAD